MGKDIISSKEFIESEAFRQLQEMAKNNNLYLMPFSFDFENRLSPYFGTYLVIMPNKSAAEAIVNDRELFISLLKAKRDMGEESFNPYFNIINISAYNQANNALSMYMHTVREIERSGIVINAFRELGYTKLPTRIDDFSCEEIAHLKDMCTDMRLTPKVRERYMKAYPVYVAGLYERLCGIERDRLMPKPEAQLCEKDFFMHHNIPVIYERMDQKFRAHFLMEITKHPQFLYYMPQKSTAELSDSSHFFEGNVLDNPLSDRAEEKIWEIMFPVSEQGTFYGILNRYNTQFCTQKVGNILDVGDPADLFTIHVMREDIYFFDQLCAREGVNFYINDGDLEYLDADATRNILLAIHKKDAGKVTKICEQIMREGTSHAFTGHDMNTLKGIATGEQGIDESIDGAREALKTITDPLDLAM